jgi:hypothetical protein
VEFESLNEHEPGDEFERELRQAFERRPAPPGLKRRLQQRGLLDKSRRRAVHGSFFTWQRMAAAVVLTAVLSGGVEWRIVQERRKEEAARQQVMTALRITSRALNRMNARLEARRGGQE